jgi:hypothetical protein
MTAEANTEVRRKVRLPLAVGVVLLPWIFSWFLLRRGHTTLARGLGLGWLAFFSMSQVGGLLEVPIDEGVLPSSVGTPANAPAVSRTSEPNNISPQTQLLSSGEHPKVYCELAANVGYPSRGYKAATGGCASNYIDVTHAPGPNGLPNNLAFYSTGQDKNPTRLERISLILNVNNSRETTEAHSELARVANSVAAQLMPSIPKELRRTILQGQSSSWATGPWTTEVLTTTWPTGLGHDVTVHFRPTDEK